MKLTNRWMNVYYNPTTNWYYLGKPYANEKDAEERGVDNPKTFQQHIKCGTIEIAVDENHQLVMVAAQ